MSSSDAGKRYAAGRMSDEEAQQFEVEMLRDPALAADVDLTHHFRAGLRRLEEKHALEGMLRQAPRWRLTVGLAAAAALVLAIAVGMFLGRGSGGGAPLLATSLAALGEAAVQKGSASSLTLLSSREREQEPSLRLKRGSGPLRISVLPSAPGAGTRYEIHLQRMRGPVAEGVARADAVPEANGLVVLYFDAERAGAGRYQMQVVGGQDAPAETFSFQLDFEP